MFGPHVAVIAGGHNITVPGQFMTDVHEKTGNEDLDIVIEDDVWVGARAMILRGSVLGEVIAADAVVTKSVPPYALVVENPARILRFRWDVDTILSHEMALYPPDRRLSREDLERWQTDFTMLPPLRQPA